MSMKTDSAPELTFEDWQWTKQPIRRWLYQAIGLLTGFVGGGWLAVRLLYIAGRQIFGRDFFQVGWLLVPFALLSGAPFGAKLGWASGREKPILIWLLFVPLASVAIGYEYEQHRLSRVDRPRDYVFDVRTLSRPLLNAKPSTGRKVRGFVVIDGVQKDFEGTIPSRFATHGRSFSFQFELIDAEPGEWFEVELSSDGERREHVESDHKVTGRAQAIGEGKLMRWGGEWGSENRDRIKP
jgi:hypothetical protein